MEMLLAVKMASVDSVREPSPDMHFNFAAQNEDDAACAAHGGRRLHDLALHARTHAHTHTHARSRQYTGETATREGGAGQGRTVSTLAYWKNQQSSSSIWHISHIITHHT